MKKYFVTGIDTGIGKTTIASILVEGLKADYWKPVQTGYYINTDKQKVQKLISNTNSRFFEESYCFPNPMSPHAAAAEDGVRIDIKKINLPDTQNTLIIEGAGGVLVPLNDKDLLIDLVSKFEAEIILVASNYLGSINHTLLTIEAIKNRNLPFKGIVFNGAPNKYSEDFIFSYTGVKSLFRKAEEPEINKQVILKYAPLAAKIL